MGGEWGIESLISSSPRVSGEKRPAKLFSGLSCGGGCDFDFMIFFRFDGLCSRRTQATEVLR